MSLAKEGLKQGITEATNFGTQAALRGIDSLAKKAVSKGAPAETTHLISSVIKSGAEQAAKQIAAKAGTKLNQGIDHFAEKHDIAPTTTKKKPTTTSSAAAGKKRKNPSSSAVGAARKKRKLIIIANLCLH